MTSNHFSTPEYTIVFGRLQYLGIVYGCAAAALLFFQALLLFRPSALHDRIILFMMSSLGRSLRAAASEGSYWSNDRPSS